MKYKNQYKAYSLLDGRDVTEEVTSGTLKELMAHDRFEVICYDGDLYKKDIFTKEMTAFFENANKYFISTDNAFAYVHQLGDYAITCINIATLEKCRIMLPQDIYEALNNGAELKISYNKLENTLLVSYSFEDKNASSNGSGVDFYKCVTYGKNFDATRNFNNNYSPTVITDYTLSEKSLNSFRYAADEIKKWAYKNDKYRESDSYNPCSLRYTDSLKVVFEKLGFEIDENEIYQDPYLTKYVLYKDEDEEIILYVSKSWFEFGIPNRHYTNGINIIYKTGDYVFEFMNPIK